MLLKLTAFLLVIGASLVVWLAPARPVIAAEQTSPLITNGLCSGVNFKLSSKGNCSNIGSQTTDRFNKIIKKIINVLSAIVGVVAVIMIIVGGFRYITSGGNDTSVTGAKNTILYAIIGLIIVALAQVIIHFVLKQVTNA